jgi:hypothetical protein
MGERGTGWILFPGGLLIWGGIMKVFDAIWAFQYHGALLPTSRQHSSVAVSRPSAGSTWPSLRSSLAAASW